MISIRRAGTRQYLRTNVITNQFRNVSHWTQDIESKPIHSFVSTSSDPHLNLSVEHFLLQRSSPQSVVLFLYVNRPCVVIGRNQNPWLELNLAALQKDRIDIVRRRSGGGAVFHDGGNVNWTVICPPDQFTRDKHVEMVVRALRSAGINRARVNERHDIVLDQGTRNDSADLSVLSPAEALHCTPYTNSHASGPKALKVSGSAYKLTRTRALHHGTCLLNSRYLSRIPQYLRSPAKPFIMARGVESVSSPVTNIGLRRDTFERMIQAEFEKLHGLGNLSDGAVSIGEDAREHPEVREGVDELKTMDWIFLQTPQFTVSNRPSKDDPRERPPIPGLSDTSRFFMKVKNGVVAESWLSLDNDIRGDFGQDRSMIFNVNGYKLHEVGDWHEHTCQPGQQSESIAGWLNNILPPGLKSI